MNKLPIMGQICLILSLVFLQSCHSDVTFTNSEEAHILNFSLKGIDDPLQSSLNSFTDFHLHITNTEKQTASYKNFNNIESIPTIEIEQGDYQVLMVANAKPEIFKIPVSPLTSQSIISLQPTAANIPELCICHAPLTVTEDENNALELILKRVVGKINMTVENVPENTNNIQIRINNMFNSVQMNESYPEDITTCTFDLLPDNETNSFSTPNIILFPTNGNVDITYTITDKENNKKVYTQTVNKALTANGVLNITTTLSNIMRSITPTLSLKVWDEPVDVTNIIIIGNEENNEEDNNTKEICFSGLPNDFTPAKLSIICKNNAGELLPVAETIINSKITIKTPNGASKLLKATFTDASNNNFSVYFGNTGTEGVSLQNVIELPKAPVLGSYYAGGIIIDQKGSEGYLAYKCTAISTDIWKNTKWGEALKIECKSINDALANDKSLSIFIEKHSNWELHYFPAFEVCRKYYGGGYEDWYFATISDLTNAYSIYKEAPDTFNLLVSKYATSDNSLNLSVGKSYITSTEATDASKAYMLSFTDSSYNKKEEVSKGSTKYDVCAVRYL